MNLASGRGVRALPWPRLPPVVRHTPRVRRMCISLPHTDTEQSPPKDAPAGMDPTLWLSLSQRLALDASGAVIRLKDKDGMREKTSDLMYSASPSLYRQLITLLLSPGKMGWKLAIHQCQGGWGRSGALLGPPQSWAEGQERSYALFECVLWSPFLPCLSQSPALHPAVICCRHWGSQRQSSACGTAFPKLLRSPS